MQVSKNNAGTSSRIHFHGTAKSSLMRLFFVKLDLLGLVRQSFDIRRDPLVRHVRAGWEGRVPPHTGTEASCPGSDTSEGMKQGSAAYHTVKSMSCVVRKQLRIQDNICQCDK